MSCVPGRTALEQRLLRALAHSVRRNHDFDPAVCAGCREIGGFLAIPGYSGDERYPSCTGIYADDALAKLGQMKDSQMGAPLHG